MEEKRIFIIVGPSGSGKDTMGAFLKEKGIPELVSHTTRKIRKGEEDGVSYHFITKEEIDEIDMAETSNYAGNFYGLARDEISNKLSSYSYVFAITDINGMEQVKDIYGGMVIPIFISVDKSDMIERMTERGDRKEDILERVRHCEENNELESWKKCKYVIKNKDLKIAKKQLYEILSKEKVDIEQVS